MEDKFNQLPKYYFNDDTLFHYTNYLSGLLITSSKKIRFSQRKKSKDPVESLKIIPHSLSFSSSDEESLQIDKLTDSIVSEVEKIIYDSENHTKQICFCKNDFENDDFGFLKPRMWNQYGDNYKGVNLVFSKQKLLEGDFGNLLFDDIQYSDYYKLRSDFGINKNIIMNEGREKYLEIYKEKIKKKLFQKHFDYRGENEFRLTINSKNNLDELNIEKSLLGVLLSVVNFEEEKSKISHFENLCKMNNLDFNIIHWKNDGFEILKTHTTEVYKIKL